ncbi:MAG TPA: hypothetical protein DD457_02635 [Gammaproteobacteria bacterium]|nr:hypothetical protein [Gammaproteobacteria bacterium]
MRAVELSMDLVVKAVKVDGVETMDSTVIELGKNRAIAVDICDMVDSATLTRMPSGENVGTMICNSGVGRDA